MDLGIICHYETRENKLFGFKLPEGAQLKIVLFYRCCVSDLEGKVRRTALAILEAVLNQAKAAAIEPLYELLAAHLACSLTHIQPAIQRDGLRFIDALSQVCSF